LPSNFVRNSVLGIAPVQTFIFGNEKRYLTNTELAKGVAQMGMRILIICQYAIRRETVEPNYFLPTFSPTADAWRPITKSVETCSGL
jgi:hypothetical protein